jgi:hypothetical protein
MSENPLSTQRAQGLSDRAFQHLQAGSRRNGRRAKRADVCILLNNVDLVRQLVSFSFRREASAQGAKVKNFGRLFRPRNASNVLCFMLGNRRMPSIGPLQKSSSGPRFEDA